MITNIYLDGEIIYTNEKVFGIHEKEKSASLYTYNFKLKYKSNIKESEEIKCKEE